MNGAYPLIRPFTDFAMLDVAAAAGLPVPPGVVVLDGAGIVDGIVPEGDTDDELRRMVAGAASIVTADELRAFLHRAENDASLVAVLEQSLA